MSEIDLDDLRSELDGFSKPKRVEGTSPRARRIHSGIQEIERFVEAHGRLPEQREDRDIFERLCAARLQAIRASQECRAALSEMEATDANGLLEEGGGVQAEPSDAELAAVLSPDAESNAGDITQLNHVRSREEIRAAEEIAQRKPCEDFAKFKRRFEAIQSDLDAGRRRTLKFQDNAEIQQGDLFIRDGQKVLVAEKGERFTNDYGRPDHRLRVVYDNGTESDLLLRSLQRALNKDKVSRRITEPELGPLFSAEASTEDQAAGHVYILRSRSEHPFVAENRDVIHKIGITKGAVDKRLSNAAKEPTYLLADVEVVATYKLANLNRNKLESVLHHFFADARLDLVLKDRFGQDVKSREWFLVPLSAIEEAIQLLLDASIEDYRYDRKEARVVPRR